MTISLPYFVAFLAMMLMQAITTPVFLRKEIPDPCLKSLIWKMVCATLFLAAAITAVICSGNRTMFANMMIVGFCFSWLGDFLLHVKPKDKLFFVLGLFSFMLGHICYITAYTFATKFYFPDEPFMGIPQMLGYIALTCAALFTLNNMKIEFGEAYLPCLIYMSVIGVMMVKAITLAIRIVASGATANPLFAAFSLTVGAVFFVISDYTLSILCFVKGVNKHGALRKLNIWTYFFGQMFLALTILHIIPA